MDDLLEEEQCDSTRRSLRGTVQMRRIILKERDSSRKFFRSIDTARSFFLPELVPLFPRRRTNGKVFAEGEKAAAPPIAIKVGAVSNARGNFDRAKESR